MTTAEVARSFEPVRELPNGANFYSPVGLFPFQADDVAKAYLRTNEGSDQGVVFVHDTGLGKTVCGMALASLLIEDDQIDQVMVVAEKNKIIDWRDEFERFTTLSAHVYHGQNRQNRLTKAGISHVLISTYDTFRTDLTSQEVIPGRKSKKLVDGPLMATLGLRGKRTLWIFDEIPALKSRGSQRHAAFAYVLKEVRKAAWQRVIGLTATPIERDIEDTYNIGRIVTPARMTTVGDFEDTYTTGRDPYGRYSYRRGASEAFGTVFQPTCLIKHKTDADVIAQFPEQIEKALWVPLESTHRKFYDTVRQMLVEDDQVRDEVALTILRMTAGSPASHLYASNTISQTITEVVGAAKLTAMPNSKAIELISRLKPLVKGQGEQAIVFSFFGRSVLRVLAHELREAGFTVAEYHGGRSLAENEHSKRAFVSGQSEILLASDAASQGLNLQNARYVFEYESALTYARRTQRINRVHRLGSGHPSVTCYTLIAEDTLEVPIVKKVLRRNEDHDDVVRGDADEGYVSAADRREMLGFGSKG
jgi:SNF2 family DNA or RNA helicase